MIWNWSSQFQLRKIFQSILKKDQWYCTRIPHRRNDEGISINLSTSRGDGKNFSKKNLSKSLPRIPSKSGWSPKGVEAKGTAKRRGNAAERRWYVGGGRGEIRLVGGSPINMAAGEGVAEGSFEGGGGWSEGGYVHRDSIAPLRPWAFSTPAGKSGSRPHHLLPPVPRAAREEEEGGIVSPV